MWLITQIMNHYMNKKIIISKGRWIKIFIPLVESEFQRIGTELSQGSMLFQTDEAEHVHNRDTRNMKTHSHFKMSNSDFKHPL